MSYGGNSIKNPTCFTRNDSLHFPPWLTERLQKRPRDFVCFFFLRERELRSCLSHGMAKKKGGGEI